MYKFIIVLFLFVSGLSANCDVIRYYNTNSNTKNISTNSSEQENVYNDDLNMVERGIFGRIYATDNTKMRMSRIERRMFNRIYPSMSLSQRMNNILVNYESGTGYCGNTSLKDRLINTFIGQPTGFTPQIYPSQYMNTYGPSFMNHAYGTNGWRYQNITRPVMTGAGVHILQ